uniref:Uncharacterized protein n=1 Tax=Siphoviridae sp. ctKwY15 TaxID=2827843 RepID=A0A8S5STP8_9CAUD|nr:MAG TPA: hypothetical protein [Siphoviridae sp. ctKwY15]
MKEKDMMNPKNWKIEEIKEATSATLLTVSGMIIAYAVVWLAY